MTHEFPLFYIEGWTGQQLDVPLKNMCTIKALLELIKVLSLTKYGTWNLMNHSVFSIPNPILHTVWSKYSTLLLSGLDFLLDFLSKSQVPQEEVSYMEKEKVWPQHAMFPSPPILKPMTQSDDLITLNHAFTWEGFSPYWWKCPLSSVCCREAWRGVAGRRGERTPPRSEQTESPSQSPYPLYMADRETSGTLLWPGPPPAVWCGALPPGSSEQPERQRRSTTHWNVPQTTMTLPLAFWIWYCDNVIFVFYSWGTLEYHIAEPPKRTWRKNYISMVFVLSCKTIAFYN